MNCDGPDAYLFLYGTLMRGESAHARFALSTRASFVGEACVPGRLIELGGYPGLVEGDGMVEGEIHRLLDPTLLVELDHYEECDPDAGADAGYVRERMTVPGSGLRAWVYRYRGPLACGRMLPQSRWRGALAGAR
jgi:gamma-glutamylcyclotransferase (GGCT)/AIG2-like uncharacterized protein YtfP